ncbi:Peptidyl-tRNA hydrolase ArfB [Phycisphaerae bacterium RAS1]|nr:Peptidyl-tRNA hydrolase ArfB [Phycisphaerae bacterium RAS1]
MVASAPDIDALRPWITVTFDRSGGPGGQNVNKLSTRATLLFDFERCPALAEPQHALIRTRLARRLSTDGQLRLVAQSSRTQEANRKDAERRLIELLTQALHVPRSRRPTRPTAASRRRRLQDKQRRSTVKQSRRGGDDA